MSTRLFDTGELTDALLAQLAASFTAESQQVAVGDGVAPAEGGWADGQPGSGIYVPYTVVVSGGAAPRALDLASHQPVWACGYSMRHFGGSRKQCDWVSTAARRAIYGIKGTELTGAKIINLEWASLGAVVRTDATDPPFWSAFDTITVVVDA